jgi:naphthoate synthase
MTINWKTVKTFEDITYKKSNGVARIAFNRPDVRNAFRPKTTSELYEAFYDAQEDTSIGVVLLSAEGPSSKDGVYAFCSGGDQKSRGHKGYVGDDGMHRLNILEVQRLIRFMPKVVIAVVGKLANAVLLILAFVLSNRTTGKSLRIFFLYIGL